MSQPKEMLLTFIILVLCCCPQNSEAQSPPPSEQARRQSRYIIDNRRNILFSSKPFTSLYPQQGEEPRKRVPGFRFSSDNLNRRPYPVDGYQKDLAAEASIVESKYSENSLPQKILKWGGPLRPDEFKYKFKVFDNARNSSGVAYDPQNSIQNDVLKYEELEDSDVGTTTERVWAPSVSPSTAGPGTKVFVTEERQFGTTTTSFPWKAEEGNQIDTGEKHVYETRIETVSFHQEVIYNPPKKENWYQNQKKNYEEPEKNYEEPEKNYEEPEKNYEEPEKNYEVDEAMNVMPTSEEEDNKNKFGYVVEGTNFRKYRVEERTPDGFIVGEYGVVSHDDGSLRGVRYTADGTTNPQLIYETLIKFLSL